MCKFLLIGALVLLSSCRTLTKTVTVTQTTTRDSIANRVNKYVDSVYVDRWHTIVQRGDTVYKTDSVYVEKVREVEVRDTVRIVERDSVPYPVEVPIDVPYVPPLYKNCTIGFWLLLIGIILVIAIRLYLR